MGFPSEKELKKVRAKLSKADPSLALSPDATQAELVKYKLCEQVVLYLLAQKITQVELAKKLEIDPARVNEIVKYKIHLFTIDKLLHHVEKLNPKIKLKVA